MKIPAGLQFWRTEYGGVARDRRVITKRCPRRSEQRIILSSATKTRRATSVSCEQGPRPWVPPKQMRAVSFGVGNETALGMSAVLVAALQKALRGIAGCGM